MTFIPLLQFQQGRCAGAMARYAEIFKAERLSVLRYFEAPPEAGMPASDLVLMAEMQVGGAILRGMDFPPGFPGEPQAAVPISWSVPDAEEGHLLFDLLAEEGWVLMPYRELYDKRSVGLTRDRFGTYWMIASPGLSPLDFEDEAGG